MRVLQAVRRLMVASCSTLVVAAVLSTPAQAQTVNFNSLGYGGDCKTDPSLWNGSGTQIGNHNGMFFGGLFALDVAHYQSSCWNMYGGGSPLNGYVNDVGAPLAPVVGLLRWPAFIQRSNGSQAFNLLSMDVGAGWTTATLTFRGYTSMKADGKVATFTESRDIDPFGLETLFFDGWDNLHYLEIDATYGNVDEHKITPTRSNVLYKTSFVSSITTSRVVVPEPASIVLLGAGLAGLALAARRRRAR